MDAVDAILAGITADLAFDRAGVLADALEDRGRPGDDEWAALARHQCHLGGDAGDRFLMAAPAGMAYFEDSFLEEAHLLRAATAAGLFPGWELASVRHRPGFSPALYLHRGIPVAAAVFMPQGAAGFPDILRRFPLAALYTNRHAHGADVLQVWVNDHGEERFDFTPFRAESGGWWFRRLKGKVPA